MKEPYKLSKDSRKSTHSNSGQTELLWSYVKNAKEIESLEAIFKSLKKSTKLDESSILKLIKEKDTLIQIPVSIFKNKLAPLEAVVLFLKNHLGYKFHKIASILNRDDRTIWLTYDNAVKKKVNLRLSSEIYLPISVFSDRKFSILENVVAYLIEVKKFSIKDISLLTDKSPKTIWTVYQRAKKKHGK